MPADQEKFDHLKNVIDQILSPENPDLEVCRNFIIAKLELLRAQDRYELAVEEVANIAQGEAYKRFWEGVNF